jgi:hypothetical protein
MILKSILCEAIYFADLNQAHTTENDPEGMVYDCDLNRSCSIAAMHAYN